MEPTGWNLWVGERKRGGTRPEPCAGGVAIYPVAWTQEEACGKQARESRGSTLRKCKRQQEVPWVRGTLLLQGVTRGGQTEFSREVGSEGTEKNAPEVTLAP